MSANAVAACQSSAVPLLALRRPGWDEAPGDRWHRVASVAEAAAIARELTEPDRCVFVTTGRQELAPFADDRERHYLIRSVDPPAYALPPRHTLLLDRGPYDVAGERALMRDHGVATLVTKDSGGPMTYPKIVAARELGIPVVIVSRPVVPDTGEVPVETPQQAVDWLRRRANAPDPQR
jgi:precorrin-6A/cobalt-precorrin-6A reductase